MCVQKLKIIKVRLKEMENKTSLHYFAPPLINTHQKILKLPLRQLYKTYQLRSVQKLYSTQIIVIHSFMKFKAQ